MTDTIRILDPVAAPLKARQSKRALGDLRGKVVGFVDNSKPNFNYLADELGRLLVDRYGAAGVVRHRKVRAGIPVAPAALADLVRRCDAIVSGSGD